MNWQAIFWLVMLIVFVLAEAGTVALVSLWFAAGALVALILSMLSAPIWMQFTLFLLVSGVMLWLLRPVIRRHFKPHLTRTNADAVIGKVGITMAPINNMMAQGKLLVDGMEWSARSTDGQEIPENVKVRIDRIEGVKLYVTPVEEVVVK